MYVHTISIIEIAYTPIKIEIYFPKNKCRKMDDADGYGISDKAAGWERCFFSAGMLFLLNFRYRPLPLRQIRKIHESIFHIILTVLYIQINEFYAKRW